MKREQWIVDEALDRIDEYLIQSRVGIYGEEAKLARVIGDIQNHLPSLQWPRLLQALGVPWTGMLRAGNECMFFLVRLEEVLRQRRGVKKPPDPPRIGESATRIGPKPRRRLPRQSQ